MFPKTDSVFPTACLTETNKQKQIKGSYSSHKHFSLSFRRYKNYRLQDKHKIVRFYCEPNDSSAKFHLGWNYYKYIKN